MKLDVLDAVWLASLPRPHMVAAIAALMRTRPPEQREDIERVIVMLSGPDDRSLRDEIGDEFKRQKLLASDRKNNRLRSLDLLQMTNLTTHQRLNRLCPSIFGPIETWGPFGRPFDPSGRAVFSWLCRDSAGVMIAGIDHVKIDECSTGFVIKRSPAQPTLYSPLRARAKSYRDLMVMLGLPVRFLDGRPIGVDWSNRKFILSRTSCLPWVYP